METIEDTQDEKRKDDNFYEEKMNWVMAVACAAVVTVSCIIPAAAAVTPNEAASEGPMAAVSVGYDGFVSCVDAVDETNDSEGIVIEGEVGDKFVVGDLILKLFQQKKQSEQSQDRRHAQVLSAGTLNSKGTQLTRVSR